LSEVTGHANLAPLAELRYLLPREESFWKWSDDGRTVEWADGTTIAFRAEINAVLARLAPGGLPPFGAVVLLLAATRQSWDDFEHPAREILAGYDNTTRDTLMSAVVRHGAARDVDGIVDDLNSVANLPPELKQKPAARTALAEFVFSASRPVLGPAAAERVMRLLEDGIDPQLLRDRAGRDTDFAALAEELDALRPGLARVTAEPVSAWMRTGLDREVRPAGRVEVPVPTRVRGLIRDLLNDPELGGVVKLARDLLAAVHVPRALAAPEDLAVGGVSDISNRGPLDRLLVSELAHDDLTLATRVALNEALYLRRESPAQHPPFARAILVDVGIRLWGVPRLFAAAVAMALAASADARAPVRAFRNGRLSVHPVDLASRKGLTELLAALEPDPHPAASLRGWLHAIEQDESNEATSETFIVTHEAALSDPEFATALRAAADADHEWYVATVSRNGAFALWLIGATGRRELCRAELSLDDIAPPPPPRHGAKGRAAASAALIARNPHLPVALFMEPFPLLLPAPINPRHAAFSERLGLIAVTHDRRLMRWKRENLGGAQLTNGLPPGKVEALFLDDGRDAAHLVIIPNKKNVIQIVTVDAATGDVREREYLRNHPKTIFFQHGAIHLGYSDEVRILSPESGGGERVVKLARDDTHPRHWCRTGRFYRSGEYLYAFTSNGLVGVRDHPSADPFDRAGLGPWLLMPDGTFEPAAGGAMLPVELPPFHRPARVRLLDVSPDGNRLLAEVSAGPTSGTYGIDLTREPKPCWRRAGDRSFLLGPAAYWPLPFPVRNHFQGIEATTSHELALHFKGKRTMIRRHQDELRLVLSHGDVIDSRYVSFERWQVPAGAQFSVRAAAWKDGSRAFLDSRGLLHLVSSDRRLPQLTLALSDRPIAGWTSDGRTFGWAYFLPDKATDDASQGERLIREFDERLR
jgi:hypothetical protein